MGTYLFTLAGGLLLLFVVSDVYITILDARGRSGPVSESLNRVLWAIWRFVARRLSRPRRHRWLHSAGPLLLPFLITIYIVLLVAGFALIYYPYMPSHFHIAHAAEGVTWFDSFYFSGVTLTTVGYGDITPRSAPMRVVTMIEGAAGLALISLAVAYLITIYTALERKRIIALSVYHQAGEGADVAGLITHHFVNGRFHGFEAMLHEAARDVQGLLESHVEHPIIHYFHPVEVYKSFPRILFLLLETPTVIRACLDEGAYTETLPRPAVTNVEASTRLVLRDLVEALGLNPGAEPRTEEPDVERVRRWEQRFNQTMRNLQEAGIRTREDVTHAWEEYRAKREEWELQLQRFALHLGYDWEEVAGDRDLEYAADEEKQAPQVRQTAEGRSRKRTGNS